MTADGPSCRSFGLNAASENNVLHYVLVSSGFGSSTPIFFYAGMKGELEEACQEFGISRIVNLHSYPARKNSDRTTDDMVVKAINYLNSLRILRTQYPLPTEVLAEAMINLTRKRNRQSFNKRPGHSDLSTVKMVMINELIFDDLHYEKIVSLPCRHLL